MAAGAVGYGRHGVDGCPDLALRDARLDALLQHRMSESGQGQAGASALSTFTLGVTVLVA